MFRYGVQEEKIEIRTTSGTKSRDNFFMDMARTECGAMGVYCPPMKKFRASLKNTVHSLCFSNLHYFQKCECEKPCE